MTTLSAFILAKFSEWSAEEWVLVIGAIAAGITGIIQAFRAKSQAAAAETKADVATKASDIANDRVSNVSRAQDAIRSDLTAVAKDSMSGAVATALLNASPTTTATPVPVEIVAAKPDAVVSTIEKPKGS